VFIYYDATDRASKPITEGRPAIRIDWHILQEKNLATRHVRLYSATNDRSSVRDNLSPSAKKARTVLPPSSGGPTCPRKKTRRPQSSRSTRPRTNCRKAVGYVLKLSRN
jgi:hypothetical protein